MGLRAYYNDNDEKACAWLRELIKAGEIPDGEVDQRSIRDVSGDDLRGFSEAHFFAGIGIWARAKRDARVDHGARIVWTGSCPCQPFSDAGKGKGTADERHLWPELFRLIRECGPDRFYGEQVASKDGLAWLDAVQADMEAAGYAFGAVDLCAAGFGAPHRRQRLYIVADRIGAGLEGLAGNVRDRNEPGRDDANAARSVAARGNSCDLADTSGVRGGTRLCDSGAGQLRRPKRANNSATSIMANADGGHPGAERQQRGREYGLQPQGGQPDFVAHTSGRGIGMRGRPQGRAGQPDGGDAGPGHNHRPGPVNGEWDDADWLRCRDGKWRPVRPGTFPLAHGVAGRVGLLRGYGNAIVYPQAKAFIEESHAALEDMRAA